MKDCTDAELMASIVKKDQEAFDAFFKRYYPFVYGRCMKSIKNPEISEEVASDVFMKVWRKADKWKEEDGKLLNWLSVMTKRTIIDNIRKLDRMHEEPVGGLERLDSYRGTSQDPIEIVEKNQIVEIVQRALNTLKNKNYKSVLELQTYEDLTTNEIADILGIPQGTVKIWLFRGRKQLEKQLRSLTLSFLPI